MVQKIPPVTKTVRIMAIAQLCIAFTVVLWHLSQPFVGDLFRAKAQLLVLEEAMGVQSENNRVRYLALPKEDQVLIAQGYARAQEQKAPPFLTRLGSSFTRLADAIPPFEQAWLILSIIVPILVLKQVEGARLAIWLVPLVALLYVAENQLQGTIPKPTAHEQLFPSEEFLVKNYVGVPLSDNILEQHAQLKEAWDRYLVDKWSGVEGSVEAGAYAFTVARAKAIVRSGAVRQPAVHLKDPVALAGGIVVWNILFALTISLRTEKQDRRGSQQNSRQAPTG